MAVEVDGFQMVQRPVSTVNVGDIPVLKEQNGILDQAVGFICPGKLGSCGDEPAEQGNIDCGDDLVSEEEHKSACSGDEPIMELENSVADMGDGPIPEQENGASGLGDEPDKGKENIVPGSGDVLVKEGRNTASGFVDGLIKEKRDTASGFEDKSIKEIQNNASGSREEHTKGQGNSVSSFGDELAKVQVDIASDSNSAREAADEWPEPKQIHSFYFIRCRPYNDPDIMTKIDQADKDLQKQNQARFQIIQALKAKRADRAKLISDIKPLRDENKKIMTVVEGKVKEIEPLQQALGKLRNANHAIWNSGLCSSEEELDSIIQSLQYRIEHESISLSEEKQILREIKQLEGTRGKVIANSAMRAKLQGSMVQKEALEVQVKEINGDLEGVRKEKQEVRGKIKQIEDALQTIDEEIKSLQDELEAVAEKRDRAYETIQQLRKKRDDANAYFYKNRSVLVKGKDLALKKDIKGLEELFTAEVEKFMSMWGSDEAFRDDYEKRILPSLDARQLGRDGRMRNPEEKPLIIPKEHTPSEMAAAEKSNIKQAEEDQKLLPLDPLPVDNVQEEMKCKATKPKYTVDHHDEADEEVPGDILPEVASEQHNEIDAQKLKEIKREEDMAKAKLALERKKKLQEKAAARAAVRAQKEAEEKLKKRERRAKKKAAASSTAMEDEEPIKIVEQIPVQEKVNEDVEAPIPKKKNTGKNKSKPKAPDSIAKIILRRKKSRNYWVWVAAAAAISLLVLLVIGYNKSH